MDKVYEAAVNRVDELARELKELKDFIELYRRTRQVLGMDSIEHKGTITSPGTRLDGGDGSEQNVVKSSESLRKRVVDNPKPGDVVAEAVIVLTKRKRPMSRRELHEALKERGMEVRGVDPVKTLGTILWRSGQEDLVQLQGYGYWIKGEPYAPADYDPPGEW